ncbi:alanine racemase [Actimicrobium sp. CCC2.4]|uniref:alanine racemase n=1 Tax=Actimicrobium sp. CCC2.4 TaxID=3048606 RepID=UPI002AC90944|nr:alanine racemase [Actimicrobium sp. CCC2.4]MEB0133887.1 alanine racemase [Actimicrobium sp. CCC2.4]WPX31428.1 alanine racemase [Actimicrobium sp. CCC2.4]
MPRPLVSIIDISALQHNLAEARRRMPAAITWAVVKANAYGHGLERGMRAFGAADGLALVEPEAAVALRELGWCKPILLLEGCFDLIDFRLAAQHRLELTIHCPQQIGWLEQTRFDAPVNVHLKMNSGMNRLGFMPQDFAAAYQRLRSNPRVGKIALMTHFANADAADTPAMTLVEQVRRFQLGSAGIDAPWNISNSAATLLHADMRSHEVRPGIMLYGGTPGTHTSTPAGAFGLRSAMTLQSELIAVQQIHPGDAVGYGSRFIAETPMTIGVVACGYADGYPRHAPSGTPVLVDGVRTRLVGNVSMDMLTVDLTPIPTAHHGSCVTLWGDGLPIDEVAQAAGTIGYELMCAIAPRVRVTER